LQGSDVDGDALSYAIVTGATRGTVTITDINAGSFTYTPDAGVVSGTDSFTFTATDGFLVSNVATVTVNIGVSSPVSHWRFDGNGEDSGTGGNPVTVFSNGTTYGEGVSGQALEPGGAQVANSTSLQLNGDLSIEFWINPSDLSTSLVSLLDKAYYGEFRVHLGKQNLVYTHGQGTKTSNQKQWFVAGPLVTNKWQHVVLTRDAVTRTVKYYLNGVLTTTWNYTVDPGVSTENLVIGGGRLPALKGKMDEVALYDKVLSPEAVQTRFDLHSQTAGY